MKISKLHTFWVIFISILYTAQASLLSVTKVLFGKPDRLWADKVLQKWTSRLLDIIGVRYTIVNPHKVQPIPGKATIIMCNHSSLYDIPLSYKAFPNHSIRMLAKKELSKTPLMGRGMVAAEFPFIDRKNRHQALRDLAYVKKLLESGIIMWIAPEGTRSKDGKIGKFKKGGFITAIQTKAVIIPMGIRGANEILPAKSFRFNTQQKAEIHIGQPIDASNYTLHNKNELIEKIRKEMKQLAGEE